MSRSKVARGKARWPGGQTMVEYAMITATIIAVVVSLFQTSGAIVETLVEQVLPFLQ